MGRDLARRLRKRFPDDPAADSTATRPTPYRESLMLRLAVLFLVIALVAALLGFGGIAGESMNFARILFFVFLVLAVLSFVFNGFRGRNTVV